MIANWVKCVLGVVRSYHGGLEDDAGVTVRRPSQFFGHRRSRRNGPVRSFTLGIQFSALKYVDDGLISQWRNVDGRLISYLVAGKCRRWAYFLTEKCIRWTYFLPVLITSGCESRRRQQNRNHFRDACYVRPLQHTVYLFLALNEKTQQPSVHDPPTHTS